MITVRTGPPGEHFLPSFLNLARRSPICPAVRSARGRRPAAHRVAGRIRAGLRAGDTVARYGGDEFLLLCEDGAQEAAARRLTQHVEGALAGPFALAGEPVTISASVGVVFSRGEGGADDLISRADQAMYRANQARRRARPRPAGSLAAT
jgi:predicted signal transduction protein with EAL and GGDEF domain